MYRNVVNDFVTWYESSKRKVLYVKGAMGVGKTWAVKDFATGFFARSKYISLNKNHEFAEIISGLKPTKKKKSIKTNINPDDTIPLKDVSVRVSEMDTLLERHFGDNDYEDCLLIFDDAENIPNSDDFFHEFARKHTHYSICVIASTMEITEYEYHYKDVFELVRMRPMSFEEYLISNKAHPLIAAVQNNKSLPLKPFEETSLLRMLKEYLLVGGMPEAVLCFLKYKDYSKIEAIHKSIILEYEKKINTTLSQAMAQRGKRIWRSIPSQLARDNKKFMYKYADENARAREYSQAAQMLCNLGFVRKLPKLTKGLLPLETNADYNSFELFFIDHGLLRTVSKLPIDGNLTIEEIFSEANGAIAEQFIFQELSNKVGYLYYWVSGATARVPFVYEGETAPVPVDIRFTPNNKAQNIKTFCAKNPNTEISLKISLNQVSFEQGVLNIPAYGLWNM